MHRACRLVVIGFAILYALALVLFIIGTFSLFGSPSGPLAGAFLVPLGLPWNRMIFVFPELLWPTLAISPALSAFGVKQASPTCSTMSASNPKRTPLLRAHNWHQCLQGANSGHSSLGKPGKGIGVRGVDLCQFQASFHRVYCNECIEARSVAGSTEGWDTFW
jgi:hypothetical protein